MTGPYQVLQRLTLLTMSVTLDKIELSNRMKDVKKWQQSVYTSTEKSF